MGAEGFDDSSGFFEGLWLVIFVDTVHTFGSLMTLVRLSPNNGCLVNTKKLSIHPTWLYAHLIS